MLNRIVILFLLFLGLYLYTPTYAMDPEEYCKVHKESTAPGTCTTKGDCVVLTTNLGTEECKSCGEGGCKLTDCDKCEQKEK